MKLALAVHAPLVVRCYRRYDPTEALAVRFQTCALFPVGCVLLRVERPNRNPGIPLVFRQRDLEALLTEFDLSNSNVVRFDARRIQQSLKRYSAKRNAPAFTWSGVCRLPTQLIQFC